MGPRDSFFDFNDFFNDVFSDFDSFFKSSKRSCNPFYSCISNFPPTDIYIEKDKTLVFEFAVARYDEKGVDLDFEGNYMILSIKKKENNRGDVKTLQTGIKTSAVNNKYYVPSDKYDYNKVDAKLSKGILTVRIPSKVPENVHKVNINTD